MGLLVKRLLLRDFRSFEEGLFSFSDGTTVLLGGNAAGKTNTVEALQLLTSGTSFRKPRPSQLIREDADVSHISCRLEGEGRVVDVSCTIEPAKKRFVKNGKKCSARDLSETLNSVLFNPDDLSFVKRGATYRRDELDGFGSRINRGYGKVLSTYLKSVEQRNRLLKEDVPDNDLLEAWNASVALGGATLLVFRLRLLERLKEKLRAAYAEVSGGEDLECEYVSSLGGVSGITRDGAYDAFLSEFSRLRDEEIRRQQTLVGPQRDDLRFLIRGRDARTFASQGQQRTIVLAWKMAEVELASEICGERPLLLLDDVMSELDDARRDAVVRVINSGIQTVITCASLNYLPGELLSGAEVVRMDEDGEGGRV